MTIEELPTPGTFNGRMFHEIELAAVDGEFHWNTTADQRRDADEISSLSTDIQPVLAEYSSERSTSTPTTTSSITSLESSSKDATVLRLEEIVRKLQWENEQLKKKHGASETIDEERSEGEESTEMAGDGPSGFASTKRTSCSPVIEEPLLKEQQFRQGIHEEQAEQQLQEAEQDRMRSKPPGHTTHETISRSPTSSLVIEQHESPSESHVDPGYNSCCLWGLVTVGLVAVVFTVLYVNKDGPHAPTIALSPPPSLDPLLLDRAADVLDYFQSKQLSDKIIAFDPNSTSPYNQTLVWIVRDDGMMLTSADEYKLIQRALVIFILFDQTVIPLEALELAQKHECELALLWRCDRDNVVREIVLPGFGLQGSLPEDVGMLTSLTLIQLTGNNGVGSSIPSTLGLLENLTELRIGANSLSGTIPSELGNLSQLSILHLHDNLFTGTIPTELANLVNIKDADFSNNPHLSGTVPFCGASARVPPKLFADADLYCPCCSSTRARNITTVVQNALLSDVALVHHRESQSLYSQTLAWLIDEELQLAATDEYKLIQRYCLLLFLFLNEGAHWDQVIPHDESSDPLFAWCVRMVSSENYDSLNPISMGVYPLILDY